MAGIYDPTHSLMGPEVIARLLGVESAFWPINGLMLTAAPDDLNPIAPAAPHLLMNSASRRGSNYRSTKSLPQDIGGASTGGRGWVGDSQLIAV